MEQKLNLSAKSHVALEYLKLTPTTVAREVAGQQFYPTNSRGAVTTESFVRCPQASCMSVTTKQLNCEQPAQFAVNI